MPTRFAMLAVPALLTLPAAGNASTVSSDGGTVTFHSGPDASILAVTTLPEFSYAIVDTGSLLTAGPGCVAGPPVACRGSSLEVFLGPGDDRSSLFGFSSQETHGGAGDDRILLWGQTTVAYGDAGDDAVTVSANGSGHGNGNAGADSLYGGGSAITLAGGSGDDLAGGEGEVETFVSGNDGSDTVVAYVGRHSQRATLTGGDGYDVMAVVDDGTATRGDYAAALDGGLGDDTVLGGPGHDTMTGGNGNDAIDVSGDGVA